MLDLKSYRLYHCTLLLKNDFNAKAISKLMGHAKEMITVDVYGDNRNIIPEELPELISYMKDVMPKTQKGQRGGVAGYCNRNGRISALKRK